MSSAPTAAGGITRLAIARAHAAGIRLQPLLAAAGLTASQVEDRKVRLNVQNQIKFVELVAGALPDDYLGFHLAQDLNLRQVDLLYYVLASSRVLGDALQRAERYSKIVNEGISVQYRTGKNIAIAIKYVDVKRQSDRHRIEFWLASLMRSCRQITNSNLMASRVKVMHQRTEKTSEFQAFFGCDVEFGADVDEIIFPGPVADMPLLNADPHLNDLLIGYCEDALSRKRVGRGSLRPNLENAIVPLLPHGKVRAGEIARTLGMSSRTLARRLSSESLNFAKILDELRSELASHYLRDEGLTISHIAWLLGYREVSAFTHAFKRWTGVTPGNARRLRSSSTRPVRNTRATHRTRESRGDRGAR